MCGSIARKIFCSVGHPKTADGSPCTTGLAAPSGAGSAPGATNPPDTDSSATANDGAGGTRGDGAGTPAAGSGAAAGRDEASAASPGAVDETGSSPRLPGGMFRAEAESIADVVRRFERERRAFDRASAAANARGGNDW